MRLSYTINGVEFRLTEFKNGCAVYKEVKQAMKIEVKQRYDTFDMTGVVAVITEGQWAKLMKCVTDKSVLIEIIGNDKLFNEE